MSSRAATLDFENAMFRYRPPRPAEPLGTPRNGYNNPRVIASVDRLQITVSTGERAERQRQIVQLVLHELPILPMYLDAETMAIRKGITGPQGRTGRHVQYSLATWNVNDWRMG